jgi:hypothetical protein
MAHRGEVKHYKQPTDIVPQGGGNTAVVPWVVFGVVSVVALAVVAMAAAIAITAICLAAIVIVPSVKNIRRK